MSRMASGVDVMCDICNTTWTNVNVTNMKAARRELKKGGWRSCQNKDVCPKCIALGKILFKPSKPLAPRYRPLQQGAGYIGVKEVP